MSAFSLGGWRLLSDMELAARFFIERGPLSHWQVWLGLAFLLQLGSFILGRYAAKS